MVIINAIVNGATTVEEVRKQTYATMGTGCCIQQVERLIECLCAPEPRKRRNRRHLCIMTILLFDYIDQIVELTNLVHPRRALCLFF